MNELRDRIWIWLAVALMVSAPEMAMAQAPNRFAGILVGQSQYDLSGTGTASIVGIRLGTTIRPRLSIEAGVTHLRYKSQGEVSTQHLFPEVHLQLHRAEGSVRPYLGAGAGVSRRAMDETSSFDPTLSVAGGVRLTLTAGWEAQGELRVRAVDPWTGTTADWGIGVARRW